MNIGPANYNSDPSGPGIRAVRFEMRPWEVWAYWDGRNWSTGTWTYEEALHRWRNHPPEARIRPDDQAKRRVMRWREVYADG